MQPPNEIAILKSIWRKDEKGAWTVHDSQTLTLKPRAGFDARYFKVKNDVNLLTSHPGKIFENVFATFVIRDPVDEGHTQLTPMGERSFKFDESLRFGIILPANPAMRNAPFIKPNPIKDAKWFLCPFEWIQHWGQEVESPLFTSKPDVSLQVNLDKMLELRKETFTA